MLLLSSLLHSIPHQRYMLVIDKDKLIESLLKLLALLCNILDVVACVWLEITSRSFSHILGVDNFSIPLIFITIFMFLYIEALWKGINIYAASYVCHLHSYRRDFLFVIFSICLWYIFKAFLPVLISLLDSPFISLFFQPR